MLIVGDDSVLPNFFFKRILKRCLDLMLLDNLSFLGSKDSVWGDFAQNNSRGNIEFKAFQKPVTRCEYVEGIMIVRMVGLSVLFEQMRLVRSRKEFFYLTQQEGLRTGVTHSLRFWKN